MRRLNPQVFTEISLSLIPLANAPTWVKALWIEKELADRGLWRDDVFDLVRPFLVGSRAAAEQAAAVPENPNSLLTPVEPKPEIRISRPVATPEEAKWAPRIDEDGVIGTGPVPEAEPEVIDARPAMEEDPDPATRVPEFDYLGKPRAPLKEDTLTPEQAELASAMHMIAVSSRLGADILNVEDATDELEPDVDYVIKDEPDPVQTTDESDSAELETGADSGQEADAPEEPSLPGGVLQWLEPAEEAPEEPETVASTDASTDEVIASEMESISAPEYVIEPAVEDDTSALTNHVAGDEPVLAWFETEPVEVDEKPELEQTGPVGELELQSESEFGEPELIGPGIEPALETDSLPETSDEDVVEATSAEEVPEVETEITLWSESRRTEEEIRAEFATEITDNASQAEQLEIEVDSGLDDVEPVMWTQPVATEDEFGFGPDLSEPEAPLADAQDPLDEIVAETAAEFLKISLWSEARRLEAEIRAEFELAASSVEEPDADLAVDSAESDDQDDASGSAGSDPETPIAESPPEPVVDEDETVLAPAPVIDVPVSLAPEAESVPETDATVEVVVPEAEVVGTNAGVSGSAASVELSDVVDTASAVASGLNEPASRRARKAKKAKSRTRAAKPALKASKPRRATPKVKPAVEITEDEIVPAAKADSVSAEPQHESADPSPAASKRTAAKKKPAASAGNARKDSASKTEKQQSSSEPKSTRPTRLKKSTAAELEKPGVVAATTKRPSTEPSAEKTVTAKTTATGPVSTKPAERAKRQPAASKSAAAAPERPSAEKTLATKPAAAEPVPSKPAEQAKRGPAASKSVAAASTRKRVTEPKRTSKIPESMRRIESILKRLQVPERQDDPQRDPLANDVNAAAYASDKGLHIDGASDSDRAKLLFFAAVLKSLEGDWDGSNARLQAALKALEKSPRAGIWKSVIEQSFKIHDRLDKAS